jgi:hypothetical protein
MGQFTRARNLRHQFRGSGQGEYPTVEPDADVAGHPSLEHPQMSIALRADGGFCSSSPAGGAMR